MEYEHVVWLIFNNQTANRLRKFLVFHGNLNYFFAAMAISTRSLL